jgi:hypothetical protein
MTQFRQVLERAHTDTDFRKGLLRNPLRTLAPYTLSNHECGVLHTLAMSMATARPARWVVQVGPLAA